ncbi:MAG: hypothetical protein AAGI51_18625 [Pseudomonadota bacterium]
MRALIAGLAAVWPSGARAHDAFGDLGPFYANALHPLVDPFQGVLLLGAAILMSRQTIETVRLAYAVLATSGVAAVAAQAIIGAGPGPPAFLAALIFALGAGAIAGPAMPRGLVAPLMASAGLAAGSAWTVDPTSSDVWLAVAGGALGVTALPLLAWGAFDLAVRRIGSLAAAVAGSWVAAIGIMAAALAL